MFVLFDMTRALFEDCQALEDGAEDQAIRDCGMDTKKFMFGAYTIIILITWMIFIVY